MKVSWDNPEKTRVCIDDGATLLVVPTTGDDPRWVAVRKQAASGELVIAEHTITRNEPASLNLPFQELRAISYPDLSELADAIYWKERGDPKKFNDWLAACDAVKKAVPKPK